MCARGRVGTWLARLQQRAGGGGLELGNPPPPSPPRVDGCQISKSRGDFSGKKIKSNHQSVRLRSPNVRVRVSLISDNLALSPVLVQRAFFRRVNSTTESAHGGARRRTVEKHAKAGSAFQKLQKKRRRKQQQQPRQNATTTCEAGTNTSQSSDIGRDGRNAITTHNVKPRRRHVQLFSFSIKVC